MHPMNSAAAMSSANNQHRDRGTPHQTALNDQRACGRLRRSGRPATRRSTARECRTLFRRVVAGDVYRKSRLHDERGICCRFRSYAICRGTLLDNAPTGLPGSFQIDRDMFDAVARLDGDQVRLADGRVRLRDVPRLVCRRIVAPLDRTRPPRRTRPSPPDPAGVRYDLRGPSSYCDLADHPDGSLRPCGGRRVQRRRACGLPSRSSDLEGGSPPTTQTRTSPSQMAFATG